MRIHNENAESFIHAVSVSIDKDPLSLENWRCLHIKSSEILECVDLDVILAQQKYSRPDLDCDVVKCADNDIFVISRSLNYEDLHAFAKDILHAASSDGEKTAPFSVYDMFRDWRDVRDALIQKTLNSTFQIAQAPSQSFDEAGAFEEIFLETKELRKSRLPLHVMLVEDDVLTRRMVTNLFKNEYSLITAGNGQEAVSNYLLHAPDIVFLDIGLPDASGFDVLNQIMRSDKDAYVVMFSGNSYLDNVLSALSRGASGFISKPFRKEKMQHYIQLSGMHHHAKCL